MGRHTTLKHVILYVSIIVILISVTYYASYAYFSAVVTGNETSTKNHFEALNIDVDFSTSSYINNENLKLLNEDEVTAKASKIAFTVTNKEASDIAITYDIYLQDFVISDNFTTGQDLKWRLTKVVDGTESLITEGSFQNAQSGENYKLTTTPLTLNKNASESYIIRMWLVNDPNNFQSSLLNGSISGRAAIYGKIE